MYTWNIDKLKDQLAVGSLPTQEQFRYILAYMFSTGLASIPVAEPNLYDMLAYAIMLPALLLGTAYVYRANGGPHGIRFTERYLSIGFVVLIRTLVVFIFPGGIILATIGGEASETLPIDVGLVVLAVLYYYWRFGLHIQEVASSSASGSQADVQVQSSHLPITGLELTAYRPATWAMCLVLVYSALIVTTVIVVTEKGRPDWFGLLFAYFGMIVVATLMLFYLPTRIRGDGIRAFDVWGLGRFVEWSKMQKAVPINIGGLRYIRLFTEGARRPLWIPLFHRNQQAFENTVVELAPPDNVLCTALRLPGTEKIKG